MQFIMRTWWRVRKLHSIDIDEKENVVCDDEGMEFRRIKSNCTYSNKSNWFGMCYKKDDDDDDEKKSIPLINPLGV